MGIWTAGVRPDSRKALFAAVASRGSVLLVVPGDADVEKQTVDVRFFLSAFEGPSDAEVERSVLPFPSHGVDPYRGLAPHFDIASARAHAARIDGGTARRHRIRGGTSSTCRRAAAHRHVRPDGLPVTKSPADLGDLLAEPATHRIPLTSRVSSASAAGSSISSCRRRAPDPT